MSFLDLETEEQILFPSKRGIKIVSIILLVGILSISYMLFFVKPLHSQNSSQITVDARKLIELTNQERINYNLPALSINLKLTQAAQNKADEILKYNTFSHVLPNGEKFSAPIKEADYKYTVAGENLAMGFASPKAIVNAWMNSQGHRDNILNPKFKDIGIFIIKGNLEGEETNLVIQYFGANSNITLSENLILYQTNLNDLKNISILS